MCRFPERFVVLGDALCSFNPIYGQGMTICALEAMELKRCVSRAGEKGVGASALKFQAGAARIVHIPWMLVTTEDFRYPETVGPRPPFADFVNWYTRKVHELTVTDAAAMRTLLGVMQMERHPLSLYRPDIAAKVIASPLRSRSSQPSSSSHTSSANDAEATAQAVQEKA
jgi:hypothetical protein